MSDIFAPDEHAKLNMKHAANPQPGDYWHEMCCPACVVLGVAAGMVIICKKTKESGPNHWTWDLSHRETKTREEFSAWLRYGGTGRIANQTWARCEPGSHMWAVKAVT